jgi:AraC-like DNA-binding protein
MKERSMEFRELWYYKPDDFDKLGGIWPVRAGYNIAKPNYTNGPRQTPYCNLHFIREGKVKLFYGGENVVLEQGDIFCKFPNTVYAYQIVPGSQPLRMAWITFDGGQAVSLLKMSGFREEKPFRLGCFDKDIELILQQIFQWCQGNSRKQLTTMSSLILRIFGKLLPDHDHDRQQSYSDWVRQSLDFIHAHYTEKITVEDVTRYVRLHRTHFSKIFTKQIGMPPSSYIINLRLERGKQLLQESPLTVTEVALSVGYPDIYSFTRSFTRQFGCSPGSFRKRLQQAEGGHG